MSPIHSLPSQPCFLPQASCFWSIYTVFPVLKATKLYIGMILPPYLVCSWALEDASVIVHLPLSMSASPVRLSLLIHSGKNSKFPFSCQSLTLVLTFPKCSSLYIILLLKILSFTTSFYSLLPNSLIWYSRVQPTSPITAHGRAETYSGGTGMQSRSCLWCLWGKSFALSQPQVSQP